MDAPRSLVFEFMKRAKFSQHSRCLLFSARKGRRVLNEEEEASFADDVLEVGGVDDHVELAPRLAADEHAAGAGGCEAEAGEPLRWRQR